MAGVASGKEKAFTKLCEDFRITEPVKKLLLNSPMESLEDFKFYWTEANQVDTFVVAAKAELHDTLGVQISRVRQAWQSLHDAGSRVKHKRSEEAGAELDDWLEEVALRDIKINFWKRYKLKYPAEIMPGDGLISMCYRELDRRLLAVTDVWTVRSLMIQVTTTKKRKKVGEDLWMMEEDAPPVQAKSIAKYLELMYTYLLALSIAGSYKPADGTNDQEVLGSDSTDHVSAPWDVLQAYYFRAVRAVQVVQENQKLSWLEKVDVQERAIWVAQYRESNATIGQVVKSVMEKRSTHWEAPPTHWPQVQSPPAGPAYSRGQSNGSPAQPKAPGKWEVARERRGSVLGYFRASQTSHSSQQFPKPGEVAKTLRDGKILCPDFQKGKCNRKGYACGNGHHKCGKVKASGRVCGMNSHGADKCWAS